MKLNTWPGLLVTLIVATVCLVWPEAAARADNILSLYTGSSFTLNSDIHVTQPTVGTDATFRDVSWDAKPFKAPPYYGLRYNHFFENAPRWGAGLDFTHYKIFAQTGQVVTVAGVFNGTPVNQSAPLNQRVQKFNITHGVNIIAANFLYRWTDHFANEAYPYGRLQPYFGGGLVYYILHPENTINSKQNNERYQGSGFGYQVLAGVSYGLTKHVGLFAETKFNSGTARVNTADQGTAETPLDTFHVIAGISLGF
jgi:lipid A oxidase